MLIELVQEYSLELTAGIVILVTFLVFYICEIFVYKNSLKQYLDTRVVSSDVPEITKKQCGSCDSCQCSSNKNEQSTEIKVELPKKK